MPHIFFGTLRDHYLLLFGSAGAFALVAGLLGAWLGAWLGARFGARAALGRSTSDTVAGLATQADVRALGDEFQALLIEVERIAEGQRFLAKVLAERNEPGTLAASMPRTRREAGTITPH
ncbi:MAG TPA: hypothetical protein VHV78_10370 [Gemmatimonadaceae bacterium]|jgi:hypothetical protein|nr:hypothetical protein [Gemmatimonadaceae bacterium]